MPIVTWTPTRDALRAKALSAGGAIATQANALADRLDTAGVPYDRRLAVWGPLTQSRAAWSAAYQLAHEQADNAARNVIPGATLPFDDMTPPTAVAARARAAVGKAPNFTTVNALERLATAVEDAWRSASGAWGSPEARDDSGWLGTQDEARDYKQAVSDMRWNADDANRLGPEKAKEAHEAIARMRSANDRANAIADVIIARQKLTGWDANGKAVEREQDYYRRRVDESLYSSRRVVLNPPMLELEHTLLATMAEAAEWLAVVG